MAARLSALHAGRHLPPGRFLVLISVRDWVDPRTIVRLEGLGKLKNIHIIGTRTSDLPVCIIVPQPTTLPVEEFSSDIFHYRSLYSRRVRFPDVIHMLQVIQGHCHGITVEPASTESKLAKCVVPLPDWVVSVSPSWVRCCTSLSPQANHSMWFLIRCWLIVPSFEPVSLGKMRYWKQLQAECVWCAIEPDSEATR
jgi:hypothetical protein